MIYISLKYYLFVIAILLVYYIVPLSKRWIVLLTANAVFYYIFFNKSWWLFLLTILLSYTGAILLSRLQDRLAKTLLTVSIIIVTLPWLLFKMISPSMFGTNSKISSFLIAPLGISFYTLQIIAYMVDVYKKKVEPQKNIFKYALFISFFPQLLQGPIPRYEQLGKQLYEGHAFNERKFTKGFCYIIWGFFLKLVIADKAVVIVNTVFDNYPSYVGLYIWIADFLYVLQLYTDFLACTVLAKGVASMFGIDIVDNFRQPFMSTSVSELWRRWHISLSSWLKDYIYIPLGGSRKGNFRKYINLIIVFAVSGFWHGTGLNYLVWGISQAVFQIIGGYTVSFRNAIYNKLRIADNARTIIKRTGNFLLFSISVVIFRSDTLKDGLRFLKHMVWEFNPWILFNDRLLTLGLSWKELLVLIIAILILIYVSCQHERGISISDRVLDMRLPLRWTIYAAAIISIILFGTYGYGYKAQDFIYGGF